MKLRRSNMGNKIKELNEIEIGNQKYIIELNGGTKTELYDIHIQNDMINICFKDYEFSQFATAIFLANKRMERFKKRYE
jgi:hypothetical protein